MKRKEEINKIRGMDKDSLKVEIASKAEELMRLRFRSSTKQLTQSHQLKYARRSLARLLTIKNSI